jgi:lysophospholipase L1-like esterase
MKKHIICLGDSNTHGYCADPADCADGGIRFNEDERWTCLLQKALGEDYLVTEEGLSGRTTVFPDPLHESMDALGVIYSCLKSHEVVDLLIIMLGTNDTKERLGANAACIAIGMERLVRKAQSVDCWGDKQPNILVVCPPPIGDGLDGVPCGAAMGKGCQQKSRELPAYLAASAKLVGAHFMDAADCQFNEVDFMHLTRKGHSQLAAKLAELVPTLL